MPLFQNLRTASSGLSVSGTAMQIIGDNIANVNTVGFKRGRANFADMFPSEVSHVHGPIAVGTGAVTGKTYDEFSQGAMQISNNNLHMAINGNGFFSVRDGNEVHYTRNGEFSLDKQGHLVSPMGLYLQGYNAEDDETQPQLGDIKIDMSQLDSKATSEITLQMNINSGAAPATDLSGLTFDGSTTASTLSNVVDLATFSTSVAVFDSLGDKHDLVMAFEKNSTNNWTCYVLADGGEIEDASTQTGTKASGNAFQIAQIDLTFDNDGSINTMNTTYTSSTTAWNFVGADVFNTGNEYAFNFGQDADGDGTADNNGKIMQLSSASTVTGLDQDGRSVGFLASLMIETDGTVVGRYDNGSDAELGKVAIATFSTTAGLQRMGSNVFRATNVPGAPSYGKAGEGGRGDVFGSSLEASNVDIEDEFVDMITAQRSYQASSRVMSATNEFLRELINLV